MISNSCQYSLYRWILCVIMCFLTLHTVILWWTSLSVKYLWCLWLYSWNDFSEIKCSKGFWYILPSHPHKTLQQQYRHLQTHCNFYLRKRKPLSSCNMEVRYSSLSPRAMLSRQISRKILQTNHCWPLSSVIPPFTLERVWLSWAFHLDICPLTFMTPYFPRLLSAPADLSPANPSFLLSSPNCGPPSRVCPWLPCCITRSSLSHPPGLPFLSRGISQAHAQHGASPPCHLDNSVGPSSYLYQIRVFKILSHSPHLPKELSDTLA